MPRVGTHHLAVVQPRPSSHSTTTYLRRTTVPTDWSASTATWQHVCAVFTRHFDNPDMQAVRAVYACFVAHGLTGQPVWPLLVGPPGSLKTDAAHVS